MSSPNTQATAMNTLRREKRLAKLTLARLYARASANPCSDDVTAAEEAFLSLKSIFEKINISCDDDELDAVSDEWLTVLEEHQDFRKKHHTTTATPETVPTAVATSAPDETVPRLPTIQLPTFDGNRDTYHSFIAKFTSAIDDRPIDPTLKLQYLLGCLRDKPQQLVAHLTLTKENYQKALLILKEKYENKRKLVFDLLAKLFRLPKAESVAALEDLTDNIICICHALETQGFPIEENNILFIQQMLQKIDNASASEFKRKMGSQVPTVTQFLDFIKSKSAVDDENTTSTVHKNRPQTSTVKPTTNTEITRYFCPACSADHPAVTCSKFASLNQRARKDLIIQKKLCYNCMRPGHSTATCTSSRCKKCGMKHHTLLHNNQPAVSNNTTAHTSAEQPHLLPTAMIPVKTPGGSIKHLRALLDSGSTSSFISEEAANNLHLPRIPLKETISGINNSTQDITEAARIQISGKPDCFEVTALLVPMVTSHLPSRTTTPPIFTGLCREQLADPNYHRRGKIDLLLSSSVFFSAIRPGSQFDSQDKTAVAILTRFGYVVASTQSSIKPTSMTYHSTIKDDLAKLWELEQETKKPPTPDEQLCEELFQSSTRRNSDGSYQVRLPIIEPTSHLYKTKSVAQHRLNSLGKSLNKHNQQQNYDQQLAEYIEKDHMEPAPLSKNEVCYLPHHAVFKNKSTTTKMRIVFDASVAPKGEKSLNGTMLNGPRLQEPLAAILIRFRKHRIAITADIEKMYRQIHLHPDQFDLHRILWQQHPDDPIKEFRLKRLTFGTKAAPFLATRVLLQLSTDEEPNYPIAAKVLREDFYIDDVMTGANTEEDAQHLRSELDKLLISGGFHLQKWNSNWSSLCQEQTTKELKEEDYVTTLGLVWAPQTDSFTFAVKNTTTQKMTKRKILSEAAQIFDPLGWANPVTMFSRIFLQTLWKENYKWDDVLSPTLQDKWHNYQADTRKLQDIHIPRYLNYHPSENTTLCGFSDASEKAMAACIYLQTTMNGTTTSRLIASKGKVAPLKTTSIPKLELTAATLLAKFMKEVQDALRLPNTETHYWTDSMITLAWIQSPSYRWETFVANRVATIQSLSQIRQWHHISSQENPADLATKTITTSQLAASQLWWYGPKILRSTIKFSSESNIQLPIESQCHHNTSSDTPGLSIDTCGTLNKLCRVYGYVLRFCQRIQRKPSQSGSITPQEYNQALVILVRSTQKATFSREIKALTRGNTLPNDSKLKCLTPFLDKDNILRVLGRLEHADLPYDQKHPMILPHTNHLTQLIIEHYHRERLHASSTLLLASIRNKFWILGGKRAIKKITHRCVVCHRLKAQMARQLMGNLPKPRVSPTRPFTNTGVDYAGPIQLRPQCRRSKIRYKGYICIFVCLATKATHLEVVSDLTSEAFIATLRRFTARRGLCQNIFSDNGTSFVGADSSLKELLDNSQSDIQNTLTPIGIKWSFIPPYSPHFGGLWEAGVKSVKYHLRRVTGSITFTYEELTTTLTQIEACLNSRPICPLTNDPDDIAVLTPGHFLIGAPLTAPPDTDLRSIPDNRLNRWQLVQKLTQDFWTRWQQEYLNLLQHRPKWFAPAKNIKEGELVLLHNANLPPTNWALGRVINIHPGTDKKSRVLTIKTASKIIQRPITKVSPLPIKDNE